MKVELFLLLFIGIYVLIYRSQSRSDGKSDNNPTNSFINIILEKYAPYSFKEISNKTKNLGREFTVKDYTIKSFVYGAAFALISWLYFESVPISILYIVVAVLFVPYLSYLSINREYAEFLFEQIQVYCSTVINEFNTTQSFVKSMEGVRDSNILEDPVLTDMCTMINMAYQNGTIDEAVEWFNAKYPYYMVKNMHQLFLQITKEGAQDSGESLENMMSDIDILVEGVYRDKMDRAASHTKFVTFGFALYFLIVLVKILVGDSYDEMLSLWYVNLLLHGVIVVNSFFLISGEKFYNEDTGVE